MRTRICLLLAAALVSIAPSMRAQNTTVDSRWLAFLGCWEPVANAKSLLCVVPAGTSTVDLLTIKKGEVVARERIAPTGQRTETIQGDCTGWQTADWSTIAIRVYLRSTDTCAGGITREGSAIIAMTGDGTGEWVYIQGVSLGAAYGQTGVHVQRYREASTDSVTLPDEVKAALPYAVAASMRARTAALAPVAINDVVEASRKVDPAVVQAWLIQRNQPFFVDAKKLVALADAGVPSSVIDLVVALSYPKRFAINAASRQGELLSGRRGDTTYGVSAFDRSCAEMPYWLDPYDDCMGRYGRYGYGYGYGYDGYGYPYGYDWYFGGPVIVYNPSGGGGGGSGGTARSHGRVINGQGYTGGTDAGNNAIPRSPEPRATTSGASSPSTSKNSGSGSSSTERTAHRRP
ncbi:MAG TPA: hypothetical protein VE714_09225 [Gemmatimonadales bacterium]|nr:hypothetical protein [Gemmatimonadales bacterium]